MKVILILLLLTLTLKGTCQDTSFRLYGYNPCAKEVQRINFFGLEKDGITYSIEDTTGVLLLRDIGEYTLTYVIDNIDTSQLGKVYDISRAGVFTDTLQMISIYECVEPVSHPDFVGYCCCEEKCEGYEVDYYTNGNKRIEGYFQEGVPINDVKIYYPNGTLKQLNKFNKTGKLKKKVYYDKQGNVEKVESY